MSTESATYTAHRLAEECYTRYKGAYEHEAGTAGFPGTRLLSWGRLDEGTRSRWTATMAPVAEQLAPLKHLAELVEETEALQKSRDEAWTRVSNIESALRTAQIACSDAAAVSQVPQPLVQALERLRAALREGLG
jgi:hypothetical protein